jgi:AraC-like DNA-binding protein
MKAGLQDFEDEFERAVELLNEGKLNISEITYQTGFSSPSVFSRAFKEAFGKTPSEYS